VPNSACKLENGFPVSINFSQDSNKIVINSNLRKLLVLDPVSLDLMYKPEDLSSCFWSHWNSKFPTITKTANSPMMPIVLGNVSNMVAAGDDHGNIYLWKDIESIKEHIGNNQQSHTTSVQRLELTVDDKRLISIGQQDQCICQYKIKQLFHENNQVNAQKGASEVAQQQGIQKIILNPTEDEGVILELNYCYQIQARKTDQLQDQTVLVRGANRGNVNMILAK